MIVEKNITTYTDSGRITRNKEAMNHLRKEPVICGGIVSPRDMKPHKATDYIKKNKENNE